MRIVAGAAKGRRLAAPAGSTRPTSDRAREGLFNALAALLELDGARVLDLFAGTGAVGLEALSRGAAEAVFVESDRRAADVLRRNADTVGLTGGRVIRQPAATLVSTTAPAPFDLVFADPPYALEDDRLAALLLDLVTNAWLAPEGIVVVERSARGPGPRWPDEVTALQDRRYGEGVLWYGRRR